MTMSFDIYNRDDQPAAAPPAGLPSEPVTARRPKAGVRAPATGPHDHGRTGARSVPPRGTGGGGGLGRGVARLVGLPGDIAEYGARGIDWATRKVGGAIGVDVAPRRGSGRTYGSAGATRAIEGVTGEFCEPQTIPGEYASTIAEFAPGALIPGGSAGGLARGGGQTLDTVVPAITSETAGQLTKRHALRAVRALCRRDRWRRGRGETGQPDRASRGGLCARRGRTGEEASADRGATHRSRKAAMDGKQCGRHADGWRAGGTIAGCPAGALDRAVTQAVYDPADWRHAAYGRRASARSKGSHGRAAIAVRCLPRLTQTPFVTNPRFQNRMTRAQADTAVGPAAPARRQYREHPE